MNWFAIGAGIALIVVWFTLRVRPADSARNISPSAAAALGLVGLFFLILGAAPGFAS